VLVPQFTFGTSQASELANAYAGSGTLTDYLRTSKGVAFPVDDWLHGIARVREKMFAWEQASLMAPVLGGTELTLAPVQLPFRQNDSWMALELDPRVATDGERLLYTAHHAVPANAGAATCGLMLDEWTEVVPAATETAGLTFHYDRPNAEPPQAWLLVVPPRMEGQWEWLDLMDAVHEAFDLARLRAVEPSAIDDSGYASFLPAMTSAVALREISISSNYSRANHVDALIERSSDG
jgi:hypothetical protein